SGLLGATVLRLADMSRRGVPLIFVGHLTTTGAMLSSERAMMLGWDPVLDPVDLAGFNLACLGHIHRRQVVADNAFYAGSPDMHGFDDQPAEQKGWWLHDTNADTHRFIPSHPRAFVTAQESDLDAMADSLPQGAVVRLILADERTP